MIRDIEILKIRMFTEGMQVSSNARQAISGESRRPLTLADYASTSGISLQIGNIWVNAPIVDHNPNFVNGSDHILDYRDGAFLIRSSGLEVAVNPIPVPGYHNKSNSKGHKYTSFAITHTDRVRISPIEGCAIVCKFCDLPYEFRYRKKDIGDLVDSVSVALTDSVQQAKHVLISGGTPKPEDFEYQNQMYRAVAQAFPGVDVDVMMAPMPGLIDPVALKSMGIHGLSINLELYDPEIAKKVMPGKYKAGFRNYLDFIEHAVAVFGNGKVRSLLMVGIEPLESTLKGVEELAKRGCDPVLSPFRPDPSTPMRDTPPPSVELLCETYLRARDIIATYPDVVLGPRCIPCMHNTLTFPDNSGAYHYY